MPVGSRLRSSALPQIVDCGVLTLGSAWNPLPPDGFYPGTEDLTERSEFPLISQPPCLHSVLGLLVTSEAGAGDPSVLSGLWHRAGRVAN